MGNALQYKKSPTDCIREQQDRLSSKLFRLNLAGREMILVGADPKLMQRLASLPSSILSARKAVADIGFEYTLGRTNVYQGTDWHKRILKQEIVTGRQFATTFLPHTFDCLEKALNRELELLDNDNQKLVVPVADLLLLVRRCVLRTQMNSLLSPVLLQEDPGLLLHFMTFQDMIEDTTAKAAVLPRWLALPVCLWPTQAARHKLVQRLTPLIQLAWKKYQKASETAKSVAQSSVRIIGPWLHTYLSEQIPPEEAAELCIGLLFAAHKNPSIGAAQCFCFYHSELTAEQQNQARLEALHICKHFRSNKNTRGESNVSSPSSVRVLVEATTLRACVLETMRMTAHTIGAVRYAEQPVQVEVQTAKARNNDDGEPTTTTTAYCIRKGETVAMAHHAMHMETRLWGANAEKFDVSRWKTVPQSSDSIDLPVDRYKLTTFSNGVHQCPGASIALAMMEMVLALLLVRDTQLKGELPPLDFERATLAQRHGPVPVRIKKRDYATST